jgi:hypothetical protein
MIYSISIDDAAMGISLAAVMMKRWLSCQEKKGDKTGISLA